MRALLAVLLLCTSVAGRQTVGRASLPRAPLFWVSASAAAGIEDIALVPAADDYTSFHITDDSSQNSRERSTDHRWFYHELDIHRRGVQCDVFFGLCHRNRDESDD